MRSVGGKMSAEIIVALAVVGPAKRWEGIAAMLEEIVRNLYLPNQLRVRRTASQIQLEPQVWAIF
jgi:hypothetical protein